MTGRVLGPGRYALSGLSVGDRIETDSRTVTTPTIDRFADLAGDRFDIHMDPAAARAHGFADRVGHGLLVLSLVDGLKNQAPAQIAARASLGWDWEFAAPVLAGDEIAVTISVEALRATSDGNTLAFYVQNQRGETVQRGTNRLMIYG